MADNPTLLHHDRMTPGDVRFFATDTNERFWVYCVNESENFQAIAQTFGQDMQTLVTINKHNPCHDGSYILLPAPPQDGPTTSIGWTGEFLYPDKLGMKTSKCAACGTGQDLNTHFLLFDILLCKLCWIKAYGKYETLEDICVICGQEGSESGHSACDFYVQNQCIIVLCEQHLKDHPLTALDGKELCETHASEHRITHNLETPTPRDMALLTIGEHFKLALRDTFENTTPFDVHGVTTSRQWRNEYMDYLDPSTPARRAQTAMDNNKLLRRKLELAFNNRAKHNKATEKSSSIQTILAKITDGATDRYCGMCVHTTGRRDTAGCFESPEACWFPRQCKGVKDTINDWMVASALRRGTHQTDDPSMNNTLCDLIGPSRIPLLGLAPKEKCSRAFMQRAGETIEEEFTLNVGSLEIFDKDFDLFRAGHAHEIHRAPQRFARMIKRWSEHKDQSKAASGTRRDKEKQKQVKPAPEPLQHGRHPDEAGPAFKHNTKPAARHAKRQKTTLSPKKPLSPAASFDFYTLYTRLDKLKTFWEGRKEQIDKERDLQILQTNQHNGIFFASSTPSALTTLGYGQRFVQQILFFMQPDGFDAISAEK